MNRFGFRYRRLCCLRAMIPTRQVLNGAYLDVSKASAHYLVGTNGRHLFSANSFALPLKQSTIIPNHKFLGCKGFLQDGEWALKVQSTDSKDPAHLEVSSLHWKFISHMMERSYPNWHACVPASINYKSSIRLDAD